MNHYKDWECASCEKKEEEIHEIREFTAELVKQLYQPGEFSPERVNFLMENLVAYLDLCTPNTQLQVQKIHDTYYLDMWIHENNEYLSTLGEPA
jgi:hypothetical protein